MLKLRRLRAKMTIVEGGGRYNRPLSAAEAENWLNNHLRTQYCTVRKAFLALDKDRSMTICIDEIMRIFTKHNMHLGPDAVRTPSHPLPAPPQAAPARRHAPQCASAPEA